MLKRNYNWKSLLSSITVIEIGKGSISGSIIDPAGKSGEEYAPG
jgi:hypothetical protein